MFLNSSSGWMWSLLSLSSAVDDVSELFFRVDVVFVVTLPKAQVESAEGVGFNVLIKPRPVHHSCYSHMVHHQIPEPCALFQQHHILGHGNQVLHVHLLHVLLVVGYDRREKKVQHAKARHNDHHQEKDVESSDGKVVTFFNLLIQDQNIFVVVKTSEEHDEAGLYACEEPLKVGILILAVMLFDHPESEGETKEKNEGHHHVGPQLLQDDMEHCGKVSDGCEVVAAILKDET